MIWIMPVFPSGKRCSVSGLIRQPLPVHLPTNQVATLEKKLQQSCRHMQRSFHFCAGSATVVQIVYFHFQKLNDSNSTEFYFHTNVYFLQRLTTQDEEESCNYFLCIVHDSVFFFFSTCFEMLFVLAVCVLHLVINFALTVVVFLYK